MSNKIWACISLGLFLLGGIISYITFPRTIREIRTVEKDKLVIKDGKITVSNGDIRLLPDGTLTATGNATLTFDSFNSTSSTVTSEAIKKLNVSRIGAIINPFDLREFGLTYSTPFLFGTEIQAIVLQRNFSDWKGLIGISIPSPF